MAEKITLGSIRIKCRFPVLTLLKCSIHARYGEHTEAEITCILKGSDAREKLTNVTDEELEIVCKGESEEKFFIGIVQSVELIEEGQYTTLLLRAVSYTWKMDIERKSRSFQNTSRTCKEVAEAVVQEYAADMVWNLTDKPLEHPLIQYKETDYCFLKRILSHLKGGIIPEDLRPEICFYAGIKSSSHKEIIDLSQYAHSLILFQNKQKTDRLQAKRQMGYEIESMDAVRVGDVLQIGGNPYYVMDSRITFEHDELNCKCQAFEKQCFETEIIPADTLKGAVLTGKVIKTEQENVKLHLDIDREQSVEEAYDFLWKPITGNLFYCMPEVGTKAALYFAKADESTGAVIYNIRENGDECGELADYSNRYFTTKNNKRMYLRPSEMGLLNMTDQNAEITFDDAALLHMKTSNKLSILAEGQVELKGKNVTLTTPKEATLVRKDLISPTVINLCNAFDAIGKSGNFAATPQVTEKKKKKPETLQEKEEYSLEGAVSAILSNIPADGAENAVMEAIAGSMPVVTKISGS